MLRDRFDVWPRDQHGRLICNEAHPMPKDRPSMGLVWVHEHNLTMEERPANRLLQCLCCGQRWWEEIRNDDAAEAGVSSATASPGGRHA